LYRFVTELSRCVMVRKFDDCTAVKHYILYTCVTVNWLFELSSFILAHQLYD